MQTTSTSTSATTIVFLALRVGTLMAAASVLFSLGLQHGSLTSAMVLSAASPVY